MNGLDLLDELCQREEALELLKDFNNCDHLDVYFKGEKNHFTSGKISLIGGINNSISWIDLFKMLKIEPQKLKSIFHRRNIRVPHFFPYNLSWFGFNQDTHYIREVEITEEILTYDELGYFEYSDKEAVKALSRILEKEIDVYKFMINTFVYEFSVYPDGRINEVIHN